MELVQSGGSFNIIRYRNTVTGKNKFKFDWRRANDSGKAEIKLLRKLFYTMKNHSIIAYILKDKQSIPRRKNITKQEKWNNTVHNYQNMNIWIGRDDGSRSDFFKRFSKLNLLQRETVLIAVRHKIHTRKSKMPQSGPDRPHSDELKKARKQLDILTINHNRLIVDQRCDHSLMALDQYQWNPNENLLTEKPVHNMASHMSDALRYALYTFVASMITF